MTADGLSVGARGSESGVRGSGQQMSRNEHKPERVPNRLASEWPKNRLAARVANGKIIELYHVQGLEHSDGMLMVYLPAERAIYTADFAIPNPPAAGAAPAPVNPSLTTLVQNIERLKIDFNAYVTARTGRSRPTTTRRLETNALQASRGSGKSV